MPDYSAVAQSTLVKPSRIENDIERLKIVTSRVIATRDALIRYAHSLGYFDAPKDPNSPQTVSPVITTMTDAIAELERESDHMVGALNLFQ